MEVSHVELIEDILVRTPRILPHTFFSLNESEQRRYDLFRKEHNKLRGSKTEMSNEGFQSELNSVEGIFTELIQSYVNPWGLSVEGIFNTYGKSNRRTIIRFQDYVLNDDEEGPHVYLSPSFWFATENENLSCNASIAYLSSSPSDERGRILYDAITAITARTEGPIKDGIEKPLLSPQGNPLYFASTDFTMSLIVISKRMFDVIGKDYSQELVELKTAERHAKGNFKEIFRRAYNSKLEEVFIQSGLRKGVPIQERLHLN